MKLKDIAYYCLFTYDPSISAYSLQKNRSQEYYWVINGLIYQIDGAESYCSPVSRNDRCQYYCCENNSYTNILHLSKYRNCDTNDRNNHLTVNLDNEITIFDKFILVHQTTREITPSENQIFTKNHYCVANGHDFSSDSYTIGLYKKDPLHYLSDISEERLVFCPIETNLRTLFKDSIDPPVQSKPAEFVGYLDERTLDQKLDDIVDELTQENRTKAIKKLKRMLNERL